jgi:hypothetical protein
MTPKESSPLIASGHEDHHASLELKKQFSVDNDDDVPPAPSSSAMSLKRKYVLFLLIGVITLVAWITLFGSRRRFSSSTSLLGGTATPTGPYKLVEVQEGQRLFDHYDFFDGPDSIGSAGYNTYVGKDRAIKLGLANVTKETSKYDDDMSSIDYVYLQSTPGVDGGGFRESVRLEGKRRFDRGLFILDVAHMPAGCGVWPAFWLTDEAVWPRNGEMDIVEGINSQTVVKTALHTSESCSMYAHVPAYAKTGVWDTATGIPDTFTGLLNTNNKVEADNCWVTAPHQWANQGCVAVSSENGTIGAPMNAIGGGVYVLEWDPANGYIKSWVFKKGNVPDNLQQAMRTASSSSKEEKAVVLPDPESWDLPYAYFAIGDKSGCSADHFQNNRLIFNLAFCGAVAGNRFFKDCPALSQEWNVSSDSVLTCNAYLESNPKALAEAYWKIRGVYVYEREMERTHKHKNSSTTKNQEG